MLRIDHFRAFESYYAVPSDADNAINGRWIKGPGTKVFEGIDVEGKIIAEDLGLITDKVRRLVKRTGFPGMKVFQFAFDGKSDNEHLPKNVRLVRKSVGQRKRIRKKRSCRNGRRRFAKSDKKRDALPREVCRRAYAGLPFRGRRLQDEYSRRENGQLALQTACKL